MKTNIKGIKIFKSKIFYDKRGSFKEVYKENLLPNKKLIFDCMSNSKKNVLRGLHLQTKNSQAKFLTVIKGKIFDVLVDLRKNSKTFGKHFSIYLSNESYCSIYIPEGFAHGFCSLTELSEVMYKVDNYYNKDYDSGIIWNDKDLRISWPVENPVLSEKDKNLMTFAEFVSKATDEVEDICL
jgi:dTDP-4-dehydrorhamnose 3,5-epimerase